MKSWIKQHQKCFKKVYKTVFTQFSLKFNHFLPKTDQRKYAFFRYGGSTINLLLDFYNCLGNCGNSRHFRKCLEFPQFPAT